MSKIHITVANEATGEVVADEVTELSGLERRESTSSSHTAKQRRPAGQVGRRHNRHNHRPPTGQGRRTASRPTPRRSRRHPAYQKDERSLTMASFAGPGKTWRTRHSTASRPG